MFAEMKMETLTTRKNDEDCKVSPYNLVILHLSWGLWCCPLGKLCGISYEEENSGASKTQRSSYDEKLLKRQTASSGATTSSKLNSSSFVKDTLSAIVNNPSVFQVPLRPDSLLVPWRRERDLSKRPKRVGVFSSPFTWGRKQIQLPKRRVSTLLNTGR
jgi:hypothetical protein